MSKEEQQIIYQLYFLKKSEREVCAAMNLVLSTFQRRKRALLEKLRKNWYGRTHHPAENPDCNQTDQISIVYAICYWGVLTCFR